MLMQLVGALMPTGSLGEILFANTVHSLLKEAGRQAQLPVRATLTLV